MQGGTTQPTPRHRGGKGGNHQSPHPNHTTPQGGGKQPATTPHHGGGGKQPTTAPHHRGGGGTIGGGEGGWAGRTGIIYIYIYMYIYIYIYIYICGRVVIPRTFQHLRGIAPNARGYPPPYVFASSPLEVRKQRIAISKSLRRCFFQLGESHTHTYIYIYIYICMYVCVCVYIYMLFINYNCHCYCYYYCCSCC